jgi:hypothetical protein
MKAFEKNCYIISPSSKFHEDRVLHDDRVLGLGYGMATTTKAVPQLVTV